MRPESVANDLLESTSTLETILDLEEVAVVAAELGLDTENADVVHVLVIYADFNSYAHPLTIKFHGEITISDGERAIVVDLDGDGSTIASTSWYLRHVQIRNAQIAVIQTDVDSEDD